MKIDQEAAKRAFKRKLREPLEIVGNEVRMSKLVGPDKSPSVEQVFSPRTIREIGDLIALERDVKRGTFQPTPLLSIQILNFVLHKMDLLEPEERTK